MKQQMLSLCLFLGAGLSAFAQQPRIVVGVVVDQMKFEYLQRYSERYTNGGFKKLLKGGFSYDSTHYNYAPTYTGPGHATIFTGVIPAQHGIIANDWYEQPSGKMMYCTQDTILPATLSKEARQSPRNLKVKTMGDAFKATWPSSKVYGVALKDRGAILPAGKKPDGAYWFDASTGNWISNNYYYTEGEPEWVTSFNEQRLPDRYMSKPWETLLPVYTYIGGLPDSNGYEFVMKGEQYPVFPHPLDKQKELVGNYTPLLRTPFGNALTLDFAMELIGREGLGVDEVPDFVSISFSSTDYVGHSYGVGSVELEDTYLRLDRELERLLIFLERDFGKNGFLLFLTSDHGASENPMKLKDQGKDAGIFPEDKVIETLVKQEGLQSPYANASVWLKTENQQLYLNKVYLDANGLSMEGARAFASQRLSTLLPGVIDVVFMTADTSWARSYLPGRSGDLVIRLKPNYTFHGSYGSTHGSPYEYDTHVPFILYGAGVKKGKSPVYQPVTNIAPIVSDMIKLPLRKVQQP